MVLIHTSIEELSKTLHGMIPNSKIAYYPEYLLEDKEAKTVIITCNIKTHIELKDFLFLLRKEDKRVVLLLDSSQNPILGYALALGIYDIVFGEVNLRTVIEILNNPRKFSEVAHLYMGISESVTFKQTEKEQEEDQPPLQKKKTISKNLPLPISKEKPVKQVEYDYLKVRSVAVLGTTRNAGSTAFTVSLAKLMEAKGEKVRIVDAGGGIEKWLVNDTLKCSHEINVIPGYITIFDLGSRIHDDVIPLAQHMFIITDNVKSNPNLVMPYVGNNTYLIGNKGADEDIIFAMADFKMVKPLFSLPETIELIKAEQRGVGIVPKKWRKKIDSIYEIIMQEG